MGINIAISETESPVAPCREAKLTYVAAHVRPGEFEDLQGRDEVVSLEDAAKAVGDMDAFFKRNRINPESDAVYMDKVKKDEDRDLLRPYAKSVPTGWVDLTRLDRAKADEVYEASIKSDAVTEWMRVEFDEMSETCSKCPLSWDKGRGCMGSFGPDNSKLPEIAEKAGCPIVASVPESVRTGKRFPKEDAQALLKEVELLRPALVADSKMAVHRYSGVLDRLQAAAEACVKGQCGFYFF